MDFGSAMNTIRLTENEMNSPVWSQMIHSGTLSLSSISRQETSGVVSFQEQDEDPEEENSCGLELRKYQKELAVKALQGQNTIICAPTGSGKTFVAIDIILKHLQQSGSSSRKVAFLARTVPLAIQQHKLLMKYLSPDYEVTIITGDSESSMSLHMLLPHTDVVVMTPMILVNHIERKFLPHLGVFSLLVFDECHHTRKGEPYNTLMYSYLKTKRSNEQNSTCIKLPQVVGMTASIGIEKATDPFTAKKNILVVCGNLDVDNIATVKENIEELQGIVPTPAEETRKLLERDENESVTKVIESMKKLETRGQKYAKEIKNDKISELMSSIPSDKKSQQYGQWAVEMRKRAKAVPISDVDRETYIPVRMLIIISQYLEAYSVALETHELVELQHVMLYLDKCFRFFAANEKRTTGESIFFDDFEKLKEAVLRRKHEENPNLRILAETLMKYLVGDKSRGIIFVRTRVLAEAVSSWLNRCGIDAVSKFNASSFTGTNASEEEGGMSPSQQEAIIHKFRSGEVRVLVATSVAEEGLDIPECSLVIKYNHVGNEVTTVQTRGRSRAFSGRSVLLGMHRILERERMNRERAALMELATRAISAIHQSEIRPFIKDYQQRILEEGDIAERAALKEKQRLRNAPFRVVCSMCRKVGVDRTKIRTIYGKYRVSIDRELLDHIKVKGKEPEYMDELQFVGTAFCMGEPEPGKCCYNKLGVVIKHMHNPFVTIGISNFGFDEGHGEELKLFKKWKKVPYPVEELTMDDITEYMGATTAASAPNNGDPDSTQVKGVWQGSRSGMNVL